MSLAVTGLPGNCSLNEASVIVPKDGTKTWTVTCDVPKELFFDGTKALDVKATLTGTSNGQAITETASVSTPVQGVKTSATVSETMTLGTPNTGGASTIDMGDQVVITTTVTNTGSTTLTIGKDDLTFSQTGGTSRTIVPAQLTLTPGQSGSFTTKFIADHTQVTITPLRSTTTVRGTPSVCATTTCAPVSLGEVSSLLAVTTQKASTKLEVSPEGAGSWVQGRILQPGDKVTVKLTLTNDGNVPLTAPATLAAPEGWVVTQDDAATALAVGGKKTYTATWTAPGTVKTETLSIPFASASTVTSCVTTCGQVPGSTSITIQTQGFTAKLQVKNLKVTNEGKDVTPTSEGALILIPGVAYSFQYTLENTGNVTVSNIQPQLTKTVGTESSESPTVTCGTATLAAGESTTCSTKTPVTQGTAKFLAPYLPQAP